MDDVAVAPLGPADVPAVERLFDDELAGRWQVRLGEGHDVLSLPGFAARAGRRLVGAVTYRVDGDRAELAALAVVGEARRTGAGGALVEAVAAVASAAGARELWLVTTNDNVDALRFYQKRGFRLAELHAGAVDDTRRRFKPEIPELGQAGIPLHDELVLSRRL